MKIFDEKGITLIELLAVFTLLMIVLPVIYGVLTSGLKLYNKIQIEGQLRDDADYAVTMIMNTFYSYPFDEVKKCGNNCIELVDNQYTKIQQVDKRSFYEVKQHEDRDTDTTTSKIITFLKDADGNQILEIDGKKFDDISHFSNVNMTYTCNDKQDHSQTADGGCKAGMVKIELELNNSRLEKPFKLTSQFGF